jgi:hypothetical protein
MRKRSVIKAFYPPLEGGSTKSEGFFGEGLTPDISAWLPSNGIEFGVSPRPKKLRFFDLPSRGR